MKKTCRIVRNKSHIRGFPSTWGVKILNEENEARFFTKSEAIQYAKKNGLEIVK